MKKLGEGSFAHVVLDTEGYAIEEANLEPSSLLSEVGAIVVEHSESVCHSMSHQMRLLSYARYCEKLSALL